MRVKDIGKDDFDMRRGSAETGELSSFGQKRGRTSKTVILRSEKGAHE